MDHKHAPDMPKPEDMTWLGVTVKEIEEFLTKNCEISFVAACSQAQIFYNLAIPLRESFRAFWLNKAITLDHSYDGISLLQLVNDYREKPNTAFALLNRAYKDPEYKEKLRNNIKERREKLSKMN